MRQCVICGKDFEPKKMAHKQKCCSAECSREYQRRWHRARGRIGKHLEPELQRPAADSKKRCVVCNKVFVPEYRGQKYCSADCRNDPRAVKLRNFFRLMADRFNLE